MAKPIKPLCIAKYGAELIDEDRLYTISVLGDFIKAKHFFTAKVFYSDFSMNGLSCLPKKTYSFSSLQDSSFSKLCTNSVYPLHKKIECLCKKNLSEES